MSRACANYADCKANIALYPVGHPDRRKFDAEKCEPATCESGKVVKNVQENK